MSDAVGHRHPRRHAERVIPVRGAQSVAHLAPVARRRRALLLALVLLALLFLLAAAARARSRRRRPRPVSGVAPPSWRVALWAMAAEAMPASRRARIATSRCLGARPAFFAAITMRSTSGHVNALIGIPGSSRSAAVAASRARVTPAFELVRLEEVDHREGGGEHVECRAELGGWRRARRGEHLLPFGPPRRLHRAHHLAYRLRAVARHLLDHDHTRLPLSLRFLLLLRRSLLALLALLALALRRRRRLRPPPPAALHTLGGGALRGRRRRRRETLPRRAGRRASRASRG